MRSYFYRLLSDYISFFVRPGDSVLEVNPQHDLLISMFAANRRAILIERNSDPNGFAGAAHLRSLEELSSWNPHYILLNGNLHYENDMQLLLENLGNACAASARLIVIYYSGLWRPLARIAAALHLRHKIPEQNWISHEDLDNLLMLAGFERICREQRVIIPFPIPVLGPLVNRFLAPLPFFRHLCMCNVLVARKLPRFARSTRPSVSIIVAARNEAGNIEPLLKRVPRMGEQDEIVFVEGHSSDQTWEAIQKAAASYRGHLQIRFAQQDGKGKGDAVRKGFSMARGEILMILDADLSVAPEDLPKFYEAIVSGKGEFINGSRLVYPMEAKAMQFFNMVANKLFAVTFSYLLGQRFKDTLCGTKVLTREDYNRIAVNRSYFGDFDPFGDFDLLFGAGRLGLKIVEIPIHYHERTYGTTNIRRWSHGLLLLRMVLFAARKIKFI